VKTFVAQLDRPRLLRRIRILIAVMIAGLVISGVTAFPLLSEIEQIVASQGLAAATPATASQGFDFWLLTIRDGLRESYSKYPWLAYGTDGWPLRTW
jgi:uncharacterized membrane protein YcjF (UPF0283 family)